MTENPPRCPRCGSHDVLPVVVDNFETGTRVVFTCDACAVTAQAWVPRPAEATP